VTLSILENAYSFPLFRRATLTRELGQTGLVFNVQCGRSNTYT